MNRNKTTDDEKAQSNQTIADIYTFLAMTAGYPNSTHISREFIAGYSALLDILDWQSEQESLNTWFKENKHPLESLQLEYTRLFINSVPHVIAPPYASVYLDGDASIQGKSTENIYDYYRQCGFELTNTTEPPDHLQHQLAFLAELVREGRFNEEEVFLTQYFRPWFTLFADKVLKETGHPFYKVSTQLIDFFTKEEH